MLYISRAEKSKYNVSLSLSLSAEYLIAHQQLITALVSTRSTAGTSQTTPHLGEML